MFGGDSYYVDNWADYIYSNYSDLWKFDISINNWIWMGDSIGGPSGRGCFAHWSDSDYNLWLFGGCVFPTIIVGCTWCDYGTIGLNDLWKYNVTTNQWSQSNLVSQYTNYYNFADYTYPQVCSPGDTLPPGTVYNTACWNRSCDNFVFYGGYEEDYDEQEYLLDTNLWNYNINTSKWTMMNKGVNFPANGANAIGWSDISGNLWMFGGAYPISNSMWKYIPDSTCPAIASTYPVHASFVAHDTAGCNPLTVIFQNTSSNNVNNLWVFGDGDSSTVSNPVHIYTTSGTYSVKLFVNNPLGCSNTSDSLVMNNYITVSDSVHAAFFADSLSGCNPLTVIFINQSYNAVSYYWDFGDGNTATSVNPSHVYDSTGVFTVKLIAYGNGVCNDTAVYSNLITVGDTVLASFHAVGTVRCDSIHFINTSANANSYQWYFGDGDSSSAANPVHQYSDTGYYTVTLIANYNGTCGTASDTLTRVNYIYYPYQVHQINLEAYPAGDTIGCPPLSVEFGTTIWWANNIHWNFGNGDSSDYGSSASVTYLNSGVFTVSVITYDQYGCTDTAIHYNFITVYPRPATPTIIQHGDTLFSSDSTGNRWYWNGGLYLSSNSYIIVSNSGCYSIKCIDSIGCKSFLSDSICFNFTGVNEAGIAHGVSIFPNPNDGSFSIQSGIDSYDLEVKDVIGRIAYSRHLVNSNGKETFTTGLSNGIYFWEILSNKESLAKGKLIIQR